MYNCPRSATVAATQQSVVWVLERDVFRCGGLHGRLPQSSWLFGLVGVSRAQSRCAFGAHSAPRAALRGSESAVVQARNLLRAGWLPCCRQYVQEVQQNEESQVELFLNSGEPLRPLARSAHTAGAWHGWQALSNHAACALHQALTTTTAPNAPRHALQSCGVCPRSQSPSWRRCRARRSSRCWTPLRSRCSSRAPPSCGRCGGRMARAAVAVAPGADPWRAQALGSCQLLFGRPCAAGACCCLCLRACTYCMQGVHQHATYSTTAHARFHLALNPSPPP